MYARFNGVFYVSIVPRLDFYFWVLRRNCLNQRGTIYMNHLLLLIIVIDEGVGGLWILAVMHLCIFATQHFTGRKVCYLVNSGAVVFKRYCRIFGSPRSLIQIQRHKCNHNIYLPTRQRHPVAKEQTFHSVNVYNNMDVQYYFLLIW